jgi:hypothetical protein
VKTLFQNDLNALKEKLNFYDFEEHNSKNGQIIIKFREDYDVVRYGDIQFGESLEDFMKQANILKNIFSGIINHFDESIVIVKYQENWIIDDEENKDLSEIIQILGVNNDFAGTISVSDSRILIEFFDANLKYNSFTHFILPNIEIILTPTDHLDIFIVSRDTNTTRNLAEDIIKKLGYDDIISVCSREV